MKQLCTGHTHSCWTRFRHLAHTHMNTYCMQTVSSYPAHTAENLILLTLTCNQCASARVTYGREDEKPPLVPAMHTSTQSAKSYHRQPPLRHDCQYADPLESCLMSYTGWKKWSLHTHCSPAVVFPSTMRDRLNASVSQAFNRKVRY